MPAKTAPPAVLADACILVKDVVSNVLYDLHAAEQIELYWTPEIEKETILHRARIRADDNRRRMEDADLIWASARLEVIKLHLVKHSTPEAWVESDTMLNLRTQARYTPLSHLPDGDDIHVALGAAYLSWQLGRAVVLVTENLADFPPDLLKLFGVAVLHPGDLLQLLYERDAEAVSQSILKTARDFKNPDIPPEKMLNSISGRNQFWNPELARILASEWGVAPPRAK